MVTKILLLLGMIRCYGEAPKRDLQCAKLYQHQKCSSCSGFRLEVNPMDQVANLHVKFTFSFFIYD